MRTWFRGLRSRRAEVAAAHPEPAAAPRPRVAASAITGVVVREHGAWSSTPIDTREILPTSVEVLSSRGRPAFDLPSAARVDASTMVHPIAPLALVLVGDDVGVVPPGAADVSLLSAPEIALLDRLTDPVGCGHLASELGWDQSVAAAVVEDLDRLGCLDAVEVQPDAAVASDDGWGDTAPSDGTPEPYPADESPRPLGAGPLRPLDPTRVPVVPVHLPRFGPPLSLGMIIAYARVWEGGRLGERFELRTPVTNDEARALLADHRGPAILLCSNYVWCYRQNLELAEELVAANPELIVVHGGPHTPKYEGDQERFFESPGVHVAVIGEGEQTAVELLDALATGDGLADLSALASVDGVVFRDPLGGELVRTPPRERIADLEVLPSPYLSGEFDDIHPGSWSAGLGAVTVTETNRGCPYKCSFCDWGSATMSRIRKFPMERVLAEIDWLAERGHKIWMVADANYGILPRDVEIAEHIVATRRRTGVPDVWGVNTAKNATRNLSKIISMLCDENITVVSSLALQTRDAATLSAIDRSNISSERYDDLALAFRRERLPILCDLIVGLPGATVESFKDDLQWCLEHEITPRVWVCQVLPNAPMNDPAYRERYALELDDLDVVVASSTFTRADREHMMGLRMAERVFEHLGLLRHVLRYLQWDHGLRAMDVLDAIVTAVERDPLRYPLLSWTMHHIDGFLMPPVGWVPFYAEVVRFLRQDLGFEATAELETVIDVQLALMPDRRREFPLEVPLAHDYVAYYRDATDPLRRTGESGVPARPLATHGAGVLVVAGDPASLCTSFRRLYDERPPDLLPGLFWHISHFELDSPLTRWVNEVRATEGYSMAGDQVPILDESPGWPGEEVAPVPVTMRSSPPS